MVIPPIRAIKRTKSGTPKRAVQERQIEDVMMHAANFSISQAPCAKFLR